MSWWETGKDRLMIGDVPADRIGSGLRNITAAKHHEGAAAPTLPQLLSALEDALGPKAPGRVIAETSRGMVHAGGPKDSGLTSEIEKIVRAVNEAYEVERERQAKPEEILANFDFVVGSAPETFLSDVDGLAIEDITFERGPTSQGKERSEP
jgi:hypothetical protein